MNLRSQVLSDLSLTVSDGQRGYGIPVILEDGIHTIGISEPFYCQVGRKNFEIDTDTQIADSDWLGFITAKLSDIIDAGFDIDSSKSWLATTADPDGTTRNYQIRYKQLDHTVGVVQLLCTDIVRSGNIVNETLIATYLAAVVG